MAMPMRGRAAAALGAYVAREAVLDAVAPAINAVCDARDYYARGSSSWHSFVRGGDGLRSFGRRSEPLRPSATRVRIGSSWFHGVSERRAALAQIAEAANALETDLAQHALAPADRAWVATVADPVLAAWQEFAAREAGQAIAPWVTSWKSFADWHDRIRRLRDLARARGIVLASPEPPVLPQTVWERAESGTGSAWDNAISLIRTVIFGVMTVVGLWGLWTLFRDLRMVTAGAL